ncbi:hypothetical protein [Rhodococcus wratislaviensis]|uniref:hypothetical protein n=1 Tax=Rhodococcus wratislaviensis TaxID=44752 RepID=UPI0036566B2A
MTTTQFGELPIFIDRIGRITARAQRASELHDWGLHPQAADTGSSLALDDDEFMPEQGGGLIQRAAMWPINSATDNVSSAGNIFRELEQTRQLRASSVMSLCRSALESSARAIWLLSDTERAVRRKRCVGITLAEMKQQTMFNGNEIENHRNGTVELPDGQADAFRRGHRSLLAEYEALQETEHQPVRPFGKTIELAGQWVEEHMPPHDSGELAKNGLAAGSKRVYSLSSGVIHGYQWIVDYGRNGDLFAMLADSFAAAVNMTECAIALYEAQAQRRNGRTDRKYHYPKRLAPTVREWSKLYI